MINVSNKDFGKIMSQIINYPTRQLSKERSLTFDIFLEWKLPGLTQPEDRVVHYLN